MCSSQGQGREDNGLIKAANSEASWTMEQRVERNTGPAPFIKYILYCREMKSTEAERPTENEDF